MHTFMRREDGSYSIGQWVMGRELYCQFNKICTVPDIKKAFRAVSILNGADIRYMELGYLELKEEA
jgi:hypothetical protein